MSRSYTYALKYNDYEDEGQTHADKATGAHCICSTVDSETTTVGARSRQVQTHHLYTCPACAHVSSPGSFEKLAITRCMMSDDRSVYIIWIMCRDA